MDEAQHDQHKRKSEEEHAFNRGNGKLWHEQEYAAGSPTGQMEDTPSAALGLTPSEIPLHIESSSPSSLYSNVILSNEEDFAGEHLDTDAAQDAQELANAAQFGPLPQTGETYSVGNRHTPSEDLPEACVPVTGPDGIVRFYCTAFDCFPESLAFADIRQFKQHELGHASRPEQLLAREPTRRPAALDAAEAATLSTQHHAPPPAMPAAHRMRTSSVGQMSSATSPVDPDELKLLDLVADYPMRYTEETTNGVVVRVYHCDVAGCKTKGTFKSEKLVRKHQRCHISEERLPCLCDYQGCSKRFLYHAYVARHQEEEHLSIYYQCSECQAHGSRYSNVFGKGRHFEKHHPGANKPTADEARVVPQLPSPPRAIPAHAAPLLLPSPRLGVTPSRRVLQSPRTPDAPGRPQVPLARAQQHRAYQHAGPVNTGAYRSHRHSDPHSAPGSSYADSEPSSSRRTSLAASPSHYSSTAMSRQGSGAYSSQSSSFMSTPSTAPTSISSHSGARDLYSDAAKRAPRSSALPPTPTRSSKGTKPASVAKPSSSPRGQSSRNTYSGGLFDIPIRAARSDHCFGGPGSRR
ncbi:hypothetical protein LTR97_012550 [Elasticomyces elasticus]|uniref:C2H2-type domain-containing protein n=1 Tax=Elasticomyces elasticus TaxID=574655 RepID=A0AAN7ZY29_9PEZI|nr:hypothetical protein LTR97_012550 [Elasticomyces elasticus]